MTLAILFSLKTMESLENGLQPYSGVTPLISMRIVSLASWQSYRSVDAWCKRALFYTFRKLLDAGVRDEAVPAPARVPGHPARRRVPVSHGKTQSGRKWRQLHNRIRSVGKGVFILTETEADTEIDKQESIPVGCLPPARCQYGRDRSSSE